MDDILDCSSHWFVAVSYPGSLHLLIDNVESFFVLKSQYILLVNGFVSHYDRKMTRHTITRISIEKPYNHVQILAEQARRLGLLIENQPRAKPINNTLQPASKKPRDLGSALEISTIHQRVRNLMKAKNTEFTVPQNPTPTVHPLPKGWEERFDPGTNRKFYIDHINRVSPFSHLRTLLIGIESSLTPAKWSPLHNESPC